MENEKRKMENEKRDKNRESFSVAGASWSDEKLCSACGTAATRDSSNFCRVCGKLLGEDYQPLDTLRASYKLQGKRIGFEPQSLAETKNLFEQNENSVSITAWAFAVYSLVPYLGIIFCPFAMIVGIFGMLVAKRKPYLGGGKVSTTSIIVGAVVLIIQIFLWLLLYFIPQMSAKI